MKKTAYIQPATSVVLLHTVAGMLANSNQIGSDGNVNLNSSTMNDGDGSDASRYNSGWDDDD